MNVRETPTTADPAATADGADTTPGASRADRVLVGVFWVWAGLLLVATLAQLFGWEGVLDVLDVKRWF